MGLKIKNRSEFLLSALVEAQRGSGSNSLTQEQLKEISDRLSLPESRVFSTASFYSMLSEKPRGRVLIQVCESPICRVSQECDILEIFAEELGISAGETTPDGLFTLEYTSCIGACDKAPAALVDGLAEGNLNREKIAAIIRENRERALK